MPEQPKEKELDHLRQLAGVLRRAFTDATDAAPSPAENRAAIKRRRASSSTHRTDVDPPKERSDEDSNARRGT
jgi:hypothetical protein